jgi:membrane protein DedA with SNARE-associated domain
MSPASLLEHYGYLAVFVGTFAEGESMLLLGGYAAHSGYLSLPWVFGVAYVAAVCSDQLYFRLGRRFGHQLLAPRPRLKSKVAIALTIVERHSTLAVFAARFLWGFRIALPVAIGMGAMPTRRYLALNLVAAALWSTVIGSIGFGAAQLLSYVIADLYRYEREIIVALVLLALCVVLVRWWPRRTKVTPR